MGKAGETGSGLKEPAVSVGASLAEQCDWLGVIKRNLKSAGEAAERGKRAENQLLFTPEWLANNYRRLASEVEKLKTEIAAAQEGLRDYWAQQGLHKVGGVTIAPAVRLELDAEAILAAIGPALAAKVIRHEPVFDAAALMHLADIGEVPRDLIEKHLTAEFSVEVKRTPIEAKAAAK